MTETTASIIEWDSGTAYELFVSLHVLHDPDRFGIRASWAAGVRSRIPAAERKLLEEISPLIGVPLNWLHSLPEPKDAISALWALKQISPAERLIKMMRLDQPCEEPGDESKKHEQFCETLLKIANTGQWSAEDVDLLEKMWEKKTHSTKRQSVERFLDRWSRPAELGENFLSALQSYYQAFFEEEEKRVAPVLTSALDRARELSATLTLDKLFVELSQGVQLGDEFRASKFIFVPAFWATPLIFFEKFDPDTQLVVFGARPADMSVVPGETLPEGLVRSLKALADPTRLKILFYLSHESLTPSELARRLQLRAPTVTHHLSELRLASLVELSTEHDERRYAIRKQALDLAVDSLNSFLQGKMKEDNKTNE
jgi:DNA-binding transcriptional ArsR family regulator